MSFRTEIAAVVLSRDEGIIAAGFLGDDFIRLLDVRRNHLKILKEPLWCIESMTISEDGKIIASGWEGGKIILCDVSGERIAEWKAHPFNVFFLAFSPNNTLLSGDEERICMWEVASRQIVWESPAYQSNVRNAFLSPDGRILVALYYDNFLQVWRTDTGGLLWKMSYVECVSLHPSWDRLAIATSDVVLMKTLSGEILWRWEDKGNYLVAFSPDGNLLAVGNEQRYVTILDAEKGSAIWKLTNFKKGDTPYCFFFSNQWLAVGGNGGSVQVFSTTTGNRLWEMVIQKSPTILLGTFSDKMGEQLIAVNRYGTVTAWNVLEGSLLWITQL